MGINEETFAKLAAGREKLKVKRIKCIQCGQTADSNTETHCPGCGAGLPVEETKYTPELYRNYAEPGGKFVSYGSTAPMMLTTEAMVYATTDWRYK